MSCPDIHYPPGPRAWEVQRLKLGYFVAIPSSPGAPVTKVTKVGVPERGCRWGSMSGRNWRKRSGWKGVEGRRLRVCVGGGIQKAREAVALSTVPFCLFPCLESSIWQPLPAKEQCSEKVPDIMLLALFFPTWVGDSERASFFLR